MKNTYAWAILAVVVVVALGAIWFMTSKVNEVPTDVVTATTTATGTAQTHTATHTSVSGPVAGTGTSASTDIRPKITSIAPSQGKVGTVAMIKGVNFDKTTNVITFGPSKGLHHRDGTADNQIESLPSSDGTSLTFTVPTSVADGELCDQSNNCKLYNTGRTKAGTYTVTVINKNGLSNESSFTVTE